MSEDKLWELLTAPESGGDDALITLLKDMTSLSFLRVFDCDAAAERVSFAGSSAPADNKLR